MSYNGAGVFSILNSFSPNTTILSAAVNANFTDIATGLSDVLTRDNQLGMAAPLRHSSGTSAAPSVTFTSNTPTGAYLRGTSNLGLVANAVGISLNQQGMRVATAVVAAGGSNYVVGDTITLTGGTATYQIILTVATLSGSAVATVSITDQGLFDVIASNPMAQGSTSGVGTGATFTITWTATTLISDLTGSGTLWGALGMSSYFSGLVRDLNFATIIGGTNPYLGFAPVNFQLNAAVATNVLTISLKNNAGTDPTVNNPVLIPFRDVTLANGGPVWLQVKGALSVDTNAAGASLGTSNSTPFRLWVVAFNNGGTVVLALINCATSTQIYPLNEQTQQSSTAFSSGATSAGTFYTETGVTVSNKAFRVLGYIDYASGLATAGSYTAVPTTIQLFGPGIKKPGDIVQTVTTTVSVGTSFTATAFSAFTQSASITPTAAPNLIWVRVDGNMGPGAGGGQAQAVIARGTAISGTQIGVFQSQSGAVVNSPVSLVGLDTPGTVASQSYSILLRNTGGGGTVNWGLTSIATGVNTFFSFNELMG